MAISNGWGRDLAQFTVLIPVYNGAEFVGEALTSVAEQTLEDVRVVVSNNASTDNTAEILSSWEPRLNMRIITQSETLPMQDHFNALLNEIETEFYMLLCHDDYLADPRTLELAQEALTENPEVAAAYCNLVYVNPARRKLATRIFKRGHLFDADKAGLATITTARNMFGIPIGIRRSSLGELRYDPQFHYAMDVDLSWALSRHQQAIHIPQVLIANRYSNANTTWKLLSQALDETRNLAQKYNVPLGRMGDLRLCMVNFMVNQKKRLFGLYQRVKSWGD
ncbi:glycosyltransferase family 2 protein [Aliiroseovarius sp. KMU-50]|uniref:Glycosyltransferase family 2 protein n=1 Tax=Aliiroseovarius salicola TaxID=3009082 RepID=A0ABT4W5E5_9RHOB|nr:glycosyltransferase family 2 protein [Aliiroseovarius sp. KMU-50]MDA5095742.1 glycosyltransferase family 2 protein [Aliiroseovarius sp. KMU-50]